MQVTLGALTVLSRRDVAINSAHVVCGALVLATSLVLTLRAGASGSQSVRLQPDATTVAHERGAGVSRTVSARAKAGRA